MTDKSLDSIINNLTANSINLEITDQKTNLTAYVNLNPKEKFNIRVFDNEHEVKLAKINGLSENKVFRSKISSFMAICQDVSTMEIFLQDFVNNLKFKANSTSDSEIVSSGSVIQPSYKNYQVQSESTSKPVSSQSDYTGNSNSYSNAYGNNYNNQPGSYYSQSTVNYGTNSTPATSTSYATSFPSNYSTNFPSVNTGTYNSNLPSMNFDNFKNDVSSIGMNSVKDFSVTVPKTNYATSSYANPSSSYANPSSSYANPSSNYVNPSSNYVNPSTSYVNPSSSYVNPSTSYLNPSTSYVNPSTSYVNPSTSYVNPTSNYKYNTLDIGGTSLNPTNTNSVNNSANSCFNSTTNAIYKPIDQNTITLQLNNYGASVNEPTNNFESKFQLKTNDSNPSVNIVIPDLNIDSTNKSTGDVFTDMKFKKFGSFVINQEEFEVNFIKEEVVKNRLNIFNQLHRHNIKEKEKKAMDLAEVDQIKIKNKSITPFFVRLSGGDVKDMEELLLLTGETRSWRRSQHSIYKVNITTNFALAGVTYNVKSGCKYVINENNNLSDPGKNTLISTSKPYCPNFELNNQVGIFFKKEDKNMLNLTSNNKSLIVVVNRGDECIAVKIEGDSPSNFEDYIEIEPLVYVVFKRKYNASYILTYNKRGLSETRKHLVSTGVVYSFTENSLGLCDDITKSSLEPFVSELEVQKKEELNVFWEKLKQLVKANPNKYKVKSFDTLIFAKIEIKNSSSSDVYIRVKSRKIGSEEFVEVKSFETRSWKRFDGFYLVEVVALHDMKSKRFLLKTGVNYILNEKLEIVDSNNNLPLKQEKETFGTNQLIYFDNIQRVYLRKDIIYEEDIERIKKEEELSKIEEEKPEEPEKNQGHVDYTPCVDDFQYFEDINSDYIKGEPFVDTHFPPDESSLRAIDPFTHLRRKPHFFHKKQGLSEQSIDHITFKRPRDAFKGQYYLFKDEICYEDVKQGQIGNCYLMSILAALSQRPDLIKAIFKTQTINPDGYYELFYHEKGEKKVIFIDDNVVLMKSNYMNEFQFAQPNGEELCVMLIEKAFAKYEGGYSNILGGLMYPELEWLTGALTREITVKDPQCWNEIYNACKARHILVTGSLQGSRDHTKKSVKGISNGHAYSILDSREYRKAGSDKTLRLMRIRNPWGHTEWKGDYSDNSPLWTPEIKAFFGYTGAGNDGVFFIPFDDYIKEFDNVIICAIDTKH